MAEYIEREAERKESVCRRCFHSYVCEQFNDHRNSDNQKCHFFNDHFVSAADVVELPCKVGDVVWTYRCGWRPEDWVAPYKITNLTITQNKKGNWTKKYRAMVLVDGNTRDWAHDFSFDEIGETTFLSKEEAERALCGARMDGE